MNYRHAFHAGNFADVMKHALLARILAYLQRKETPIRVIDTHAGIGLYDLTSDEAGRTGEWREGIGRLDEAFSPEVEEILAPYRRSSRGARPPWRRLSRLAGDPARNPATAGPGVFVELHPTDHAVLARRFSDAHLKVLHLDGWTALHALIPPKEKRGLVLIDPPYEEPNELERLGRSSAGPRNGRPASMPAGIRSRSAPVDAVAARLRRAASPRPGLRLELYVDDPRDATVSTAAASSSSTRPGRGKGGGDLLPALAERLSRRGYGAFAVKAFGPPLRSELPFGA